MIAAPLLITALIWSVGWGLAAYDTLSYNIRYWVYFSLSMLGLVVLVFSLFYGSLREGWFA